MHVKKLIIKNFKCLKNTDIDLNPHLNIIVGDNESGKSTLLEAINLVLTCQINGRGIQYELSPFLFNEEVVNEYLDNLRNGQNNPPPSILVEAYFSDDDNLAKFKGTNNSIRENCPGIKIIIEFDEEYEEEYSEYIGSPEQIRTIPIEYYATRWYSFANNPVTKRSLPINATFIDTSQLRFDRGPDRYLSKIIGDVLEPKQRVDLSLEYRKMREVFLEEDGVQRINEYLATKKGDITNKDLSISMDVSSRTTWETSLTPHLDEIPFSLIGKGEQSCVKVKLAMEASDDAHIFLVEEPENHLSYPNVNKLIGKIGEKGEEKQIIVATHSSFVLNKLGIENVILFNRGRSMKLDTLIPSTRDYFMKLPGHDTLRLILSQKAILVEGPSDELIVQKAFFQKHGAKSLERNVDVISVQSLAFKRFLEIAVLLDLTVCVVTDNDGDIDHLEGKYTDYIDREKISIYYDEDEGYPTLEPQLLKANSLDVINRVLDKEFENEDDLLAYMEKNKTDCALKIFNGSTEINFPEYINHAID